MCEQNLEVLEKLALECRKMDTPLAESGRIAPSPRPGKETMIQRVDDAIKILREPFGSTFLFIEGPEIIT